MGYARIVSGGPDGRYVIELDYGEATRVAVLAALSANRAELDIKLVKAQEDVDEATEVELAQAQLMQSAQEAYIADLADLPPGAELPDNSAWEFMQGVLLQMRAKHAPLRLLLVAVKFDLLAVNKEIAKWTTFTAIEQRPAWCTTLTEDLAPNTYSATVEIPGESNLILIAPNGRTWQASDGYLQAREVMAPWQAFFNAAILPGWQRDKPTYRWGTITAIDYDLNTADIALAEAKSSAQQLNVNQTSTLLSVPVLYFPCNARAFEVDDRVVVEFQGQNWAQPRIIGFLDNPKSCNAWRFEVAGRVHRLSGEMGYLSVVFRSIETADEFYAKVQAATTTKLEFRINRGAWQSFEQETTNPAEFFTKRWESNAADLNCIFVRNVFSTANGNGFILEIGNPSNLVHLRVGLYLDMYPGYVFPHQPMYPQTTIIEVRAMLDEKIIANVALRASLPPYQVKGDYVIPAGFITPPGQTDVFTGSESVTQLSYVRFRDDGT